VRRHCAHLPKYDIATRNRDGFLHREVPILLGDGSMPLIHPSINEVYSKVDQAIAQLLEKDFYLLQIDANERAISHRLGLYLQLIFEDWHVDCEYNRNLDDPKRVKQYERFFAKNQRIWNITETDPITVFPDIIVHERNTHNNLLVIEMKKTTSHISSDFDYFKLRAFKYQFGYPHALFLRLITARKEVGVETKDYLPEREPFMKKAPQTALNEIT
jgi:hypothetical protein